MRLADIQLSIPFFLLAVAVLAIVGGSVENLILVLIICGWVPYARVVRSHASSATTSWSDSDWRSFPRGIGRVIYAPHAV